MFATFGGKYFGGKTLEYVFDESGLGLGPRYEYTAFHFGLDDSCPPLGISQFVKRLGLGRISALADLNVMLAFAFFTNGWHGAG